MSRANIREAWDAYRASLSRADSDRERLRAMIRDALAEGFRQADIARDLGISRQQLHRLLNPAWVSTRPSQDRG